MHVECAGLNANQEESKWNRILRYRLGGGVRECRDWMGEEENMCKVCSFEQESWVHV